MRRIKRRLLAEAVLIVVVGTREQSADRPPNDQLIIQAVKQSSEHDVKSGKVWQCILGCEPLFNRLQPDVMCHLLVNGLSKHIWSS